MAEHRPLGDDLRVPPPWGPERAAPFTFVFQGAAVQAHPGETIATALLANGVRALRLTRTGDVPRGLFCGIGACFDCLVIVNGIAGQRACVTPARPGDRVEVQGVARLE
jgi:predicted molibdopterin-dependent oxidoreductase YjgC